MKQQLNEEFRRMQKLAGLQINEVTNQIQGKDGIVILVSDYVKNHIMTHNKVGVGSVFKSGITEDDIEKMTTEVASKVSGDGGAYELNKPGIGYDLVLPMDKARALKGAKEGEIEKQEGPNKIKVPSITTTQPLSDFASNRISLIIRKSNPQFLPDDIKDDKNIMEKIKEKKCYSLLTAFPGNPDIPKASEWNNKYAVIIPSSGTKLGENISEANEDLFSKYKEKLEEFREEFVKDLKANKDKLKKLSNEDKKKLSKLIRDITDALDNTLPDTQ